MLQYYQLQNGMKSFYLALILSHLYLRTHSSNYPFPDDFLFGTATASYQTEGAWNESGKGVNIWDTVTHNHPELIADGSNGDVACDSYHKYEEDIALMKDLGVDFYRFSLSWARIFPSGHPYQPNPYGIAHYNKVIDALIANNITPMVTIYHWDLPQGLQDLGGFPNKHIVSWFTEFARVVFENFADRVKYWITFNEPVPICQYGYGEASMAPLLAMSGIADYLCSYSLLKAHAAVYHLYNTTYKPLHNGKVGITLSMQWYEPNTTEDEEAAERMRQFQYGWFANPIYSSEGDFPAVMKEYVANRSLLEGYKRSRLPSFTKEEVEYIRGTYDFLGVNHYTTGLVANSPTDSLATSFKNDMQVTGWRDPTWPTDDSGRQSIVPWGFRKLLVWIKDTYDDPEIHITENGCPDFGGLNDTTRISYYGHYLEALLEAIYEYNVTVKSYAAWSLLDNFEWLSGYTYGIHYVDFSDPDRPRIPKLSATFYKNVIGNRAVGAYDKVL